MDGYKKDTVKADAALPEVERVAVWRFVEVNTGFLNSWRETRFAKQSAKDSLTEFKRLQAERPDLSGQPLYEYFVSKRGHIDAASAQTIVRRAKESFAAWPNDRELIFRDVVQYLAISEYLASHAERVGTSTNMTRAIASVISDKY